MDVPVLEGSSDGGAFDPDTGRNCVRSLGGGAAVPAAGRNWVLSGDGVAPAEAGAPAGRNCVLSEGAAGAPGA
ncbi:MAG: hypothetical protein WA803_16505, partial [Steroidobacteraceae bacterium]